MSSSPNPIHNDVFPRSNGFDPDWVMRNQMGPNALWLVEWLSQAMDLKPGMRVLDLGCGKALTSIFLARELDVQVHALDLWVHADDNWLRAVDQGVANRVTPMRVEAHALPFAKGYFDAVVSVDSYQYWGTDDLYLNYLASFVREGGQIGVAMPGLMQPIEGEIPAHLLAPQRNGVPFWEDDCVCFHTADWWRRHWSTGCKRVRVDVADTLEHGWRHWRDFENAIEKAGKNIFPSCAEALEQDQGRYIGFVRVVATRTQEQGLNLYDPQFRVE